MNFLADESVDQPIVERLRADGHDVLAVAEMPQVFQMTLSWPRRTTVGTYY